MNYNEGDKIKLTLDHSGKPLSRPKYGYVIRVMEASARDRFFTEQGMMTSGYVYLIQTSWSGGALWYTADALKPAKGKNELAAWRQQLKDYHDAQTMKHGAY